jgi:hypothetical protein
VEHVAETTAERVNGPFFIGVDFWRDPLFDEIQTVSFSFDVASIERSQ